MRLPQIIAMSALLGPGALCACLPSVPDENNPGPGADPNGPPNVILILTDDQDYEHVGFAGNTISRMPTVDALAAEGVIFDLAHLPMSRCRPTLASFLSGRWPHQTRTYANFDTTIKLNPQNSLPNVLHGNGWATYAGGKYWEGDKFEMGFRHGMSDHKTFLRMGQEEMMAFIDLAQDRKKPFFIWYAPKIPHIPHDPPQRYLDLFDAQSIEVPDYYAGETEPYREAEHLLYAMEAWLDDGISELVDKLKATGAYDNTLFVFVMDNGWTTGLPAKGSAFEKGLRTPVVFTWPRGIEGGRRFDEMISTLDIFPTILDLVGLETPEAAAGRSLLPFIESQPEAQGRDVLFGAIYPSFAMNNGRTPEQDVYAVYARTREYKYILYLKDVVEAENQDYFRIHHVLTDFPARSRGDEDLFALQDDPYELEDLADQPEHRALMNDLRSQILAWWSATGGAPLPVP